ncbi:MAG: ABC transporter permease [Pseudomonadota bacterium]
MNWLRFAPTLAVGVLIIPLACGLLGTIIPAFGYLPAVGGNSFNLDAWYALAAQPGIFRSAVQSFAIGVIATAISVALVALFTAGWYGTRVFARLQAIVSPLLAVPHAAAAFGFAFMVMPSGFIARLISPWATGWDAPPDLLIVNDTLGIALIFGLVLKEIPFLLLMTLAALPQVPVRRSLQFAQSVGYGQISGFLITAWPAIYPQIRLAVYAVIAYATANVDMAIILGPTVPQTLPVRLSIWMSDPDLSMRFMSCAGACLQILVTGAALLFWLNLENLFKRLRRWIAANGWRAQRDTWLRWSTAVAIWVSAGLVFGGLAILAIWSVSGLWQFPNTMPESFTLRTWQRTWPRLDEPLSTTLIIGVVAVVISVVLTVACLVRENQTGQTGGNRALIMIYLPLLVPQIGFLFGLQFFFFASNTDASWMAVILVHVMFVLPYVFLSLSAPWRAFDTRYEAISAALGKTEWSTLFMIKLPILSRAVLAAAAVGFAVSVGQYLPTLLVGSGRFATITTEAVALGAGGNRRVIGVYTFLQMMLPFIGFAIATLLPALIFRNRRAIRTQ